MAALYDVLVELSPAHDAELMDGFRRYETQVAEHLTPQQLSIYADEIRQSGAVRIFDELTPRELASMSPEMQEIASQILADISLSMENRRVAALLHQRGEHELAPDHGAPRVLRDPVQSI
jgi:cytochrome P450